ncbi:MAG: hypothetical protein HDQ88_09375 [Clostridia bacterium]|nr:hypothetical protein [Clostridia bacterium]
MTRYASSDDYYGFMKDRAIDIYRTLGNGDELAGESILINLCSFLRVARMKHRSIDQNRTQLMNDFLEEVEELKGALEGTHEHDFPSELMDCMTVLVRLWNYEYVNQVCEK